MDKQTKQLIALGVLVVAALIVAAIQFEWIGGGDDEELTSTTETAEAPATGPQNAAAGDGPAAGAAQDGDDDEETQEDLPMPAEVVPTRVEVEWPWERTLRDPPYDPLYVQNIDVVEPGRKQEIEQLQQTWVLEGISVTKQRVPLRDRDGQQVIGEPLTEPKPRTRLNVVKDEEGNIVYDRNGRVVMDEEIVYEVKRDESGEAVTDEAGNPEYVMIPKLDEFNEPEVDDKGNIVMVPKPQYVQAKDENGEPIFDDDGNPVWEQQFRRDENGDLMIKQVPAWEQHVKLEDGDVVLDDYGRPVIERKPAYEVERDERGNPIIGDDGEPRYRLDENEERIRRMVPDDTPQWEDKYVKEAWFAGRRGPFREGDRLTNTLFTITEIFNSRRVATSDGKWKVRKGVDLYGDNGARITLYLTDDSRYGDVSGD